MSRKISNAAWFLLTLLVLAAHGPAPSIAQGFEFGEWRRILKENGGRDTEAYSREILGAEQFGDRLVFWAGRKLIARVYNRGSCDPKNYSEDVVGVLDLRTDKAVYHHKTCSSSVVAARILGEDLIIAEEYRIFRKPLEGEGLIETSPGLLAPTEHITMMVTFGQEVYFTTLQDRPAASPEGSPLLARSVFTLYRMNAQSLTGLQTVYQLPTYSFSPEYPRLYSPKKIFIYIKLDSRGGVQLGFTFLAHTNLYVLSPKPGLGNFDLELRHLNWTDSKELEKGGHHRIESCQIVPRLVRDSTGSVRTRSLLYACGAVYPVEGRGPILPTLFIYDLETGKFLDQILGQVEDRSWVSLVQSPLGLFLEESEITCVVPHCVGFGIGVLMNTELVLGNQASKYALQNRDKVQMTFDQAYFDQTRNRIVGYVGIQIFSVPFEPGLSGTGRGVRVLDLDSAQPMESIIFESSLKTQLTPGATVRIQTSEDSQTWADFGIQIVDQNGHVYVGDLIKTTPGPKLFRLVQ